MAAALLRGEVYRALQDMPPALHRCCCPAPSSACPLPPLALCSKILQLGIRLFAGVSLLVLATVLPINLTGGQVGGQVQLAWQAMRGGTGLLLGQQHYWVLSVAQQSAGQPARHGRHHAITPLNPRPPALATH